MFRGKDSQGKPKYVGASRAKVLDDRDPLSRGRILVDHPLLGSTSWIPYLTTPGSFNTPSVGDLVYVQCESGEPEYAYAWGNASKGEKANASIPDRFKRTVPTNRGFYTPGGHYVELDDGEAKAGSDPSYKDRSTKNRGIRITSSQSNKIHIIEDDDAGTQQILIQDKEGSFIKLDYKNKELTISSVDKSKVHTTGDKTETVGGALSITVTGNATINTDGNATISAAGNVEVSADGNATFKGTGQTTVGDNGSPTNVNGQQVLIAGGGPGVARLGDRAFGIGNLGAPVSSTIIQGSTKVLSG